MPTLAEYIRYLDMVDYVINLMGLLGNVFSFIIFSRKAFEKSSIGIYCKSLAIFDSFVVFKLTIGIASLIKNTDLFNENIYACKIVYMSSFILSPIPGWVLVTFSVDQLIIVSRTKRFGFIKTKIFQYGFIVCIFLLQCLIYSMASLEMSIQNVTSSTSGNLTVVNACVIDLSSVYPYIYLIDSNLVPFVLMMLLTCLILKCLVDSRRKLEKVSSTAGSLLSSRRKYRDLKWAVNSVALNLLFIVLTCPLVIVFITPIRTDYYENEIRRSIAFVFWYVNFAAHFWIHFTVNSIFRNEILVVLGLRNQ